MRLLQFFFVTLWVIGYTGNGILFLYIQWIYLRQGWIQIFNPLLQVQILLTLLSTPLFWIFLLMAILGYYLASVIEKQIARKKREASATPDQTSSASPATKTGFRPQSLPYFPRQVEKATLFGDDFIVQKTELLNWAIQSSKKVEFDYKDRHGAKSHRITTPIQIKTAGKTIILEAYCYSRKANRTFDLAHMNEIRLVSIDEFKSYQATIRRKSRTDSSPIKSRTLERPYIKCYTNELEEIVNSKWSSVDILKDIRHELSFRSSRRAHDLNQKIFTRLTQLQRMQFSWPTTTAKIGAQDLPSNAFKHEEGMLRHYGYKVGIHGLDESERLKILNSIFLYPLMPMDDSEYVSEWGEPKTARRLQKLAESIAAFTRNAKRRNESSFSKAIQDWEADLAYLKKAYYDNCFSFTWPRT